MIVLLKLTTAGTDTGPFNLFTNINYVTPFSTNVTKASLVAGLEVTVPDTAITIRLVSTGNCINSIDVPIAPYVPPTTSTTTTIPNPALPCYDFAVDATQVGDGGGTIAVTECTAPYNTSYVPINKGDFFFLCKGNVTSTTPGMIITKNEPCTPVVTQATGTYGRFDCVGGVVDMIVDGTIGALYYNAPKLATGVRLYSNAACTTLVSPTWTCIKINGNPSTRFAEVGDGIVTTVYAEGSPC
jgi:hypothetical protein